MNGILPLNAHGVKLGVIAVAPIESDITNEQKHLLEAYTSSISCLSKLFKKIENNF
jgi:hypothetical protein